MSKAPPNETSWRKICRMTLRHKQRLQNHAHQGDTRMDGSPPWGSNLAPLCHSEAVLWSLEPTVREITVQGRSMHALAAPWHHGSPVTQNNNSFYQPSSSFMLHIHLHRALPRLPTSLCHQFVCTNHFLVPLGLWYQQIVCTNSFIVPVVFYTVLCANYLFAPTTSS